MLSLSTGVFIGSLVTNFNRYSLIFFFHPPPIPLKKKLCEVYHLVKANTTVLKHKHENERINK